MELAFITLDVFTDTVFKGNPLAVVTLPPGQDLSQAQKQAIAREFNLSESVFLHDEADASSKSRRIDIFTTTAELPFAGHPTVGSAVAVRALGVDTLITGAGPIRISHRDDGHVRAEIPFRVRLHARRLIDLQPRPAGLADDERVRDAELRAPVFSIVKGMTFVLAELPSLDVLGVVVTRETDFRVDSLLDEEWRPSFVGKYYFVRTGERVDEKDQTKTYTLRTRLLELGGEDPATGSAACCLCSYLALREPLAGRDFVTVRFEVTQGVEMGRESNIAVDVVLRDDGAGAARLHAVYLGGTARIVMSGTIQMPAGSG